MQSLNGLLHLDGARLARLHGDGRALKACYLRAVGIQHLGNERKGTRPRVLVSHLRLSMYHSLASSHVEVGGIDIRARRAKVGIERQCLVEFACYVKPYVFGNTAVVGIEVPVVPLVTAVVLARTVGPAVVAAHSHYVVARLHIRCHVKAEGHHAVFAETEVTAIDIDVGTLPDALELDEYFALHCLSRKGERLTIPHDGVGQFDNITTESLAAVEGVGQRHTLPVTVVEGGLDSFRHVTDMQAPVGIEVQFLPLCGMCGRDKRQQ